VDAPRDKRRAFDVIVRRATPGDLDGICAVAESVRLNPLHAQEGGFLVYVLDRQGYADRLAASDLFYVAIDRDEVVGFLLCYDDRTVVDLVEQGVLSDDMLRARAVAGCDGRWIYGDQLAVHPAHACQEVGISLAWELYRQLRNRGSDSVFVAILHDPPNTRSKAFCEALGFVFKGALRYKDGFVPSSLYVWIAKRRTAEMTTTLRRWIEVDTAKRDHSHQ
jgi:ribosomal protein S18 acetylase RimI-like enzyme